MLILILAIFLERSRPDLAGSRLPVEKNGWQVYICQICRAESELKYSYRNIKDKYGFTVLHHAVYRENLRLVNKVLKVRGVKYEEQDEQGNTALHLAALGANVELIKSLMRNKEQILEVNREGQTPLHLAAGTGAVRAMRTILNSPEGKKTLESEDSRHQTPLLIAASVGSKEVINLMLSHGASVRKRNSDKETPLHICARFGLIR